MSTKIEGRLERNDGGAAATLGEHLVELFYSRIIQQDGENPTQLTVLGQASTRSRAGGAFEFVLADGDDPVGEKVRFVVSALSGKPVADVTLDIQTIRQPPVVLKVAVVDPTELVAPDEPVQPPVVHVNGQLIDPDGKPVPCGLQVTVVARPAQSGSANGAGEPVPVMAARADRLGAFFGDVANEKYAEAAAIVSGANGPIPVALQDGRMPSRLLLAAEFPDAPAQGVVVDDCGCHDVPPRSATQGDIAYAPDTYSTDLGTCGCPQFNTPNRAIEEFDYYTVVRTTQPDVRSVTLADADRTHQSTNGNGGAHPVIAASYDVQLNTREGADPGRIRITLVTANGGRRVLSETGSTVEVDVLPDVPNTDAIEAFEAEILKNVAVRFESFAVTENAGVVSAIGVDVGTVRSVEVEWISTAAPHPWGLTGIGITATSTDGAAVPILIEGEELHTVEPWIHVFMPSPTKRQLWTGTASVAVPSTLRLARFAASANPDPSASDHVTPPIYRPPDDMLELLPLGRSRLDADNAVDWDSTPTVYEAATVASGHLLHFKQVWYADGYSLGDLLYSLPLAPGQKKLISVVDWERRERTERTERTTAREGVDANLTRDRDLGEVVTGTLTESVRGGSRNTTAGVGAGTGGAGNGTYQGMNFGALLGVSGGYGESNSDAWQVSGRALATSSMQTLRDKTLQSASAVRSLRSSVVQTVTQGESTRVTTEVVANHNHCHALTVQYFEVLRHLKVTHELADVQECLFVPLPITEFDRAKVLRWRQSLEAYLHRGELAAGFDAVRRVETNWSEVDYPVSRYADEKVTSISGELEITLLIPLPPLPEKPKPRPEDTADQVANAVKNATNPTTGFLGVLTAIATGGASLLVNATVSAAQDVTKASIEGARALSEDLLAQPTPEEKYAKFQREVMPGVVAGFVDQLELHALVRGSSVRLGSADFTLVSDYRPGIPLLCSVKATLPPSISRADIQQLIIKSHNGLPPGCRAIVNTATLRYRTRLFEHPLVDDRQANDDIDLPVVQVTFPDLLGSVKVTQVAPGLGAAVATPLDAWEQRNPRTDDRALAAELLDHLNEQLEYYHHAIWWTMDPNRRYMLLDGYVAPGPDQRSIASVVENRLIGIVGNSLVLPVAYGVHLDPRVDVKDPTKPGDLRALYPAEAVHPARVSLPTRGVFAEAVMGACNACETIDDSKLWRWEESPIDEPPAIEPASTATRRTEPASVTPTAFPAPIVSIDAAPAAPDPVGVAAALNALGQQSFADITGLAGTQANAAAAYGKALDTALAFGKEASTLAQQAGMLKSLDRSMAAIDKAADGGKIDQATAARLRTSALEKLVGQEGGAVTPKDVAERVKLIDDLKASNSISPETAQSLNKTALRSLVDGDTRDDQAVMADLASEIDPDTITEFSSGGEGPTILRTSAPGGGTAPIHARGLSGLGSPSGEGSATTTQLWSGAKTLLEAVADGVADWKDAPDKELSDAVIESIKSAALDAADDITDEIPLVKGFKVGVKLSLVFADGVGAALTRTNTELAAAYKAGELAGSGSEGLTPEDVAAIQALRAWQLNSVNRVSGILAEGVEAVVDEALTRTLTWATSSAVKAASGVAKQLVGHYLTKSGAQAMLAEALGELRTGISPQRQAFYKEVLTTVIGLYVRQLDDPGLRTKLAPLAKVGPDKPLEKMLLSTLASLLIDPVSKQVDASLRKAILAKAHALMVELRAGGQTVAAGSAVDADATGVTLPRVTLIEIENGPDAAKAAADDELATFTLTLGHLQDGATTLARTLGRMRQRGLVLAMQRDDTDTHVRLWNNYNADLRAIFIDLNRAAQGARAALSAPVQEQATEWLRHFLVLPRLVFEAETRWEPVQYDPDTGYVQVTTSRL